MFDSLDRALEWRCIGPHRGGRVVAVAGDPADRNVFYFGACAGGVWKTFDGGTYWQNVSDGFFNTASVGAIAVAESDPNVIYAGTGEACIRNDVSHGDGVYKSTDGGETWANVGLADTRHIARVRVHPKNPDLVYVAALGHAFGPNSERGVFRSQDGGGSWERVLFKSDKAGAADLSMDPNNPRVLYASIWEAQRTFWDMTSGGEDSGLWKSTDGGDTWTDISERPGLPVGVKGRIGVAVSPAKTGRVWALVEAKNGALFRSDDGGETWERLSDEPAIRGRAWYYSHIIAHPTDPETVWSMCWEVWKSTDGGSSFAKVTVPHDDNHDLWIDPRDPQRMIEGNDGGACVSYNGGDTWSTIYNQPTAQFYHLATDNQFPYRAYATQQDNSAISVPSMSDTGAILWGECYLVGSSESGHIVVKPDDPNVVYSGAIGSIGGGGSPLLRYDHRTKQVRAVTVWPESNAGSLRSGQKYRFAWTFPIEFSPHDPNTLYAAANVAFRSTDEGESWQVISPDLTRDDPEKQQLSGGPINVDAGMIEMYCTIFAFLESPHERGVFWAGSDDGLVHLSRDDGKTWENVTPPDLPEWSMVHMIEPSPHDAATVYLAATRYKLDDNRPFLFRTRDYGKTWSQITGGIPDADFTRVIREDPERPGLLYAGTETGVHVSLDDGESWRPLHLDRTAERGQALPVVPVYDMEVKGDELVVATHGRGFWVLGGLGLLRQLGDERVTGDALFAPSPSHRVLSISTLAQSVGVGKNYSAGNFGIGGTFYRKPTDGGGTARVFLDAGTNPPAGGFVNYFLAEAPDDGLTLAFTTPDGTVVRELSSRGADVPRPTARAGMNRFVWDMRYASAELGPDPIKIGKGGPPVTAPLAAPGEYRVVLSVAGSEHAESLKIVQDPRSSASQEDLQAQLDLLVAIRDRTSEARRAVRRIGGISQQVQEWESRAAGREGASALSDAAADLLAKAARLKVELIAALEPGEEPQWRPAGVGEMLEALFPVVSSTDAKPTAQSCEVFEELSARLDSRLGALQGLIDGDVAKFASLVRSAGIPLVEA